MSLTGEPEKKDADVGTLSGAVHGLNYSDKERGGKGEKAGEGILVIDGEGELHLREDGCIATID